MRANVVRLCAARIALQKLLVTNHRCLGRHVLVVGIVSLSQLLQDVMQRIKLRLDSSGLGPQPCQGEFLRQEMGEERCGERRGLGPSLTCLFALLQVVLALRLGTLELD